MNTFHRVSVVGALIISLLVSPAVACDELYALIGGAKRASLADRELADEKLVEELRGLKGSYDAVILNPKVLADEKVLRALRDSPARFIFADADGKASDSFLTTKLKGMQYFAVLPTDADGIKHVFGNLGDKLGATAKYMNSVQKAAEKIPNCKLVNGKPPVGQTWRDYLLANFSEAKQGELVGLLCHSEKENIPLPDGTSVKFLEVHKAIRDRGCAPGRPDLRIGERQLREPAAPKGGDSYLYGRSAAVPRSRRISTGFQ